MDCQMPDSSSGFACIFTLCCCMSLHEVRIIGREGLEFPAVLVSAGDVLALNGYARNLVCGHRFHEIAERHILVLLPGLMIDVEKEKDKKDNKKPDKYAFIEWVETLVFHD